MFVFVSVHVYGLDLLGTCILSIFFPWISFKRAGILDRLNFVGQILI